MSVGLRDDLDRTIDDALTSAMKGGPRRVSAATVRRAIEAESSGRMIPAWFAAAAALIVALGLWWKPAPTTVPPPQATRPALQAQSVSQSAGSPKETVAVPSLEFHRPVPRPAAGAEWVSAMEPLPSLRVEGIAPLAPLANPATDSEALVIPSLSLPSLSIPVLSNDYKQ